MKVVELGHCNTCGREVKAVIDWENFISPAGEDLATIQVEGHCGVPGHAMRVRTVSRDELAELPNWEQEDDPATYIHDYSY